MLLAVLAGFLLALVIAFFGRFFKGRLSVLLGLLPLGIFNYFLYYFPYITAGNTLKFSYQWIPSLGLNLDFRLDGLSLLFSLLISGIGALVFFYASAYLQGHKYLDRFYGYLSLFMAAMLGLVLSDNVLLVFTFWELTSISSFFLIGFNNDSAESRKSALTALAITGLGGFFLLSGFILMGLISETYSITGMLLSSDALHAHPFYGLMLFFLFVGAFSKSAQYPLHFWLPGAMKAPTPVSAYLHSATMVKAGIYLLARLSPVMGDHPYWNITLMVVGGITMLYAAIHTLFKTDLKSILAYSTISALGVCVFLLGIGTAEAILALSTFILVHALYKAALFLVTGTIDHETGTRDVMKLQGLRKQYPLLAGGALIAALSNAGIPLTFGFIGKDLMYEATLHGPEELKYILTGVIVTTNILLAYAGFMVGIKPFIGAEMTGGIKHAHKPSLLLTVPPILLGMFSLLFGIAPVIPDELIVSHTTSAILGAYFYQPLKIWHGFNLVLLLSGVTIFLGFLLFRLYKPRVDESESLNQYHNRYAPKSVVDRIGIAVRKFALHYTRFFNDGYLRSYVLTIIVFFVALIGYKLFSSVDLKVSMSNFTEIRLYELVIFAIMVVAIIMSVFTSSRLTAIASMSIIGYAICLLYVFYGAPDLAMTQFTIDTLTVVLFVLVLFRLPQFMNLSSTTTKIRDGIVSLSFGSLISIITLQALISPANKEISRFYADNAYRLAKGKNVVNVILVDFRGFDTMVEIMVLTIAALGVFSLLKLNAKPTDKD